MNTKYAIKMCEFFEYKLNHHGDVTGEMCRLSESIGGYCVKYCPYRENICEELNRNMSCLYKFKNKNSSD